MRPLHVEFWGFWPRQALAGLVLLLVAAVLSLVLFPAGHGSFVSTHGPATAFRSRRLFSVIYFLLATLVELTIGLFPITQSRARAIVGAAAQLSRRALPGISPPAAVLLC